MAAAEVLAFTGSFFANDRLWPPNQTSQTGSDERWLRAHLGVIAQAWVNEREPVKVSHDLCTLKFESFFFFTRPCSPVLAVPTRWLVAGQSLPRPPTSSYGAAVKLSSHDGPGLRFWLLADSFHNRNKFLVHRGNTMPPDHCKCQKGCHHGIGMDRVALCHLQ